MIYRLEVLENFFIHPILLEIDLNASDHIVDDRPVNVWLDEESGTQSEGDEQQGQYDRKTQSASGRYVWKV